jgi:hypothetical protein
LGRTPGRPAEKARKALGREAPPCDDRYNDECGPDRRVCSYRPQFLFDFWQPSGVDGHDHVSFVVFMPFQKAGREELVHGLLIIVGFLGETPNSTRSGEVIAAVRLEALLELFENLFFGDIGALLNR